MRMRVRFFLALRLPVSSLLVGAVDRKIHFHYHPEREPSALSRARREQNEIVKDKVRDVIFSKIASRAPVRCMSA